MHVRALILAMLAYALLFAVSAAPGLPVSRVSVAVISESGVDACNEALHGAVIRSVWPGRTRVGMILNPARSRYAAGALVAWARREGFSLPVVDCDGPSLLKVLADLDQRLPPVGYSPAFVRAGALAGVFPNYGDVERRSAEMAGPVRVDDRPSALASEVYR